MTSKIRIGMLTPSSNTALEPLTCAMLRELPDVSVHYSRLHVMGTSLDRTSTSQFTMEAFLGAASLLADARVDVIAWNGTSGSWMGLDWERALCRAIEAETGVRATGSTLAFFDAFAKFGVKRYSLAVPYVRDHTEKIIETYAREGLECVASDYLGFKTNAEIDLVPESRFREQLASVAVPDSEGIAVVCTNVPAAPLVDDLERSLGIPIFDSIAVTAWKCLEMVGIEPKLPGWGKLLRGETAGAAAVK
jgi:maleate isomerase